MIENIFLLILFLLICFYLPIKFGQHEGEVDFQKIQFDGSRNSLGKDFHRKNFIKRFFVGLAISFTLNYVLKIISGFSWWFCLPYLFYFATMFNYEFTQTLNKRRGFHAWYVSPSPNAAYYDKMVVKLAIKMGKPPYETNENLNKLLVIIATLELVGWIAYEILC